MTIAGIYIITGGTRRYARAGLLVLALTFTLAGCSLSGMLTNDKSPPKLFVLSPESTFSSDIPYVDRQLVVEVPVASEGLNTHRIALRESPLTLDYFPVRVGPNGRRNWCKRCSSNHLKIPRRLSQWRARGSTFAPTMY